jgi:hypothetical protein
MKTSRNAWSATLAARGRDSRYAAGRNINASNPR